MSRYASASPAVALGRRIRTRRPTRFSPDSRIASYFGSVRSPGSATKILGSFSAGVPNESSSLRYSSSERISCGGARWCATNGRDGAGFAAAARLRLRGVGLVRLMVRSGERIGPGGMSGVAPPP